MRFTGSPLKFKDAIDFLEAALAFPFKPAEQMPRICIYDDQNKGYSLILKADLVSKEYRKYLGKIAESQKLVIKESEGYLQIHSIKKIWLFLLLF